MSVAMGEGERRWGEEKGRGEGERRRGGCLNGMGRGKEDEMTLLSLARAADVVGRDDVTKIRCFRGDYRGLE